MWIAFEAAAHRRTFSQTLSLALHAGLVSLLFALSTSPSAVTKLKDFTRLTEPLLAPQWRGHEDAGGSGGDRSVLPSSLGALPKPSPRPYTPPVAVIVNEHPALMMEPAILAPQDAALANVPLDRYGNPWAPPGPPSNGRGSGAGVGDNDGGGVGTGRGPGAGPGNHPGIGGAAFTITTPGLTLPVAIYKPEPEYSEDARKAKIQGSVFLTIIIDIDGIPKDIRVKKPLGLGLDEKAVEAVGRWRFRPGAKDGKPVPVAVGVDVRFHLL